MRMQKNILLAAAVLSITCATTAFAGWQQDDKGYWYQYDDGRYAKAGIKDIEGTYYAFDADGYMQRGWQYIAFRWYYFDPVSGAQAFGWTQVDGNWYYLDPENFGAMYTYWLDIGKDRYYLDERGVMQTGIFYLSDSTTGSDYAYQTDENGVLIRNTIKRNGTKTIKYDDNGIMMYRNETTKTVADATGDTQWQYVRNAADMEEQKEENTKIIEEEANSRKDSLYEEYKSKVANAKNSQRDKKKKAWEAKVRKKLAAYMSAEELEAYIQEVEKGRYVKSTAKKYEDENEDEDDIDYYYDNYDE